MAYCTRQDIGREIGATDLAQTTDDVNGTTPDDTIINDKIAESTITINDYLRSRYALPITDTETLATLRAFCTTLTACKLYDRRLKMKMPEALLKTQEGVMKELEKIQQGRRKLSAQGAGEHGKRPGFYRSNATARCEVFSEERLSQY